MLSRWFKKGSRLEHADPEVRLQAVKALTAEQAASVQDSLERLVCTEEDHVIRHAAFPLVCNTEILASQLDSPEHGNAAAQVIAQRIEQGEVPSCASHPQVIKVRFSQAHDNNIDGLLTLIDDAAMASEFALTCPVALRDKVLSAQVLQNEAGLSTLLKVAKGRDKFCHRYAKDKLDAIKTAVAQHTSAYERLTELDASISKALSQEPTENIELIAHRQKLLKLQEMRAAAADVLRTAQTTHAHAGGQESLPPPQEDPLKNADLTIPDATDNPFIDLAHAFETLQASMLEGVELASANTRQIELTQAWLAHTDKFPPNQNQHKTFALVTAQFQQYRAAWQRLEAARGSLEHVPAELISRSNETVHPTDEIRQRLKWLKRWQKSIRTIDWPTDHQAPADALTAQTLLLRVTGEQDQLAKLSQASREKMLDIVKQAAASLADGQMELAKEHLKSARKMQKQGISDFDREISSLSAQIAEFSDWQNFATNPKREELLSTLTELADNPIEPADQAERVKMLRQQWQELGKPGNRKEFDQHKQFDDLAQKAFEPCKVYFSQLADTRAQNLEKRAALCDQLTTYLSSTDWISADMQAAETIMRTAREEWHRFHPCDRRALKPVQTRFESLQDQLHAQVKAGWNANVKLKEDIVADALKLLESQPDDSLACVKALQQRWQQVGRTPRGPDQRLWRTFRTHCDAVFAQRDATKRAEKDVLTERYTALEAMIGEFEQALSTTAPTKKSYTEMQVKLTQAAENLTLRGGLRKNIDNVQAAYKRALVNEEHKRSVDQLGQWQQWDEIVSAAEASGSSIDSPHSVFNERLQGKPHEEDLLALTLEAEIAADIASPPEDQSQRMVLQVAFMNAGKRNLAAEDYRDLLQRWCAAGPKNLTESIDVQELRQRFFAAIAQRLKK